MLAFAVLAVVMAVLCLAAALVEVALGFLAAAVWVVWMLVRSRS
jgi:hypothetical protein